MWIATACLLAVAGVSCTDLAPDNATTMDAGGSGGGPEPSAPAVGGTGGGLAGTSGTITNGITGPEADGGSDAGMDSDAGSDAATVPAGCMPQGALRCAAAGSAARQICSDGVWLMTDACSEGELCDSSNSESPGSCASAASFCQGSADQSVCVDGVMHQCNGDAISVSQLECASQRHCQLGLVAGSCAVCIPSEDYRCEGAELQVCDAQGTGYELADTCATEALCNAGAKACTADACLAGGHNCTATDVLQTCNADRTAFEDTMPCQSGLCDDTAGQCDICSPGDKLCMNGAPATCDAQGQGYDVGTCAAPRSICTGQGVCVECTKDAECTTAPPRCRANLCSVGSGTCTTAVTGGAACTMDSGGPGVCTDLGGCVQCMADGDCKSPGNPRCNTATRQCVPCLADGDCTSAGAPRCNTATKQCVPCLGNGDCSTTMQCRAAYCDTTNNQCKVAVAEGASCGFLDVCNSQGDCVDCISDGNCNLASLPRCDTSAFSCVECTANSHCTTGSENRCNLTTHECVECTTNSHCSSRSDGRTRCNTGNGQCVQCTTASHCGSLIDWSCDSDGTCLRKPRCGNGILEPANGEQCDEPADGDNTCQSNCKLGEVYGICSYSGGDPTCALGTGQCSPLTDETTTRTCNPLCPCPDVVGWNEVCIIGFFCAIGCNAGGGCPIGYNCVRYDYMGETNDICVPP